MMEVHAFAEADRAGLRGLFGRAGEGAPPGSLWGHEESEAAVYLDPYMDLEPGSLFVAATDGYLVGYLAGCLDSARFPSESDRVEEAVREYRLIFQPKAAAFFARAVADVARAKVRREPTAAD
ncbi:MAG TPA: hypothetical protein VGV91_04305, partial [Rubrobacter sp.]|nr:hypothetical protein [Rubrobacter sp.]